MEITSTTTLDSGVIERRFTVAGAGGRPVPGVLWTRADTSGASGPTPLVLIGHGGGGSKDVAPILARRDDFTGARGIAVAAIDGPA